MNRSRIVVFAAFLAQLTNPGVVGADSISDEATLGGTRATAGSPATHFIADRLNGIVDVSDEISLRLGAVATRYSAATGISAETVFQFTGGATWEVSDHVALGVDASISPTSTGTTAQPATFESPTGAAVPVTVRVRTQTSTAGLGFFAEYDTAGESNWESVVAATVGGTSYAITQTIPSFVTPGGQVVDRAELRAFCQRNPCSSDLRNTLDRDSSSLWQLRASLDFTETVFRSTDFDLLGTYYLYTADPSQVGYYTAGSFSRTTVGDGIPTQPLRFAVRPGVLHRFGSLGVGVSFQHGQYVDGLGHSEIGGLRVEYRFTKAFKAWITGNLENDVNGNNQSTHTGWVGIGARLRF